MASREEKFKPEIIKIICNKKYENGISSSQGRLPPASDVRCWLEEKFAITTNRNFRVILVEDIGDYRVFIQVPDGKSESDFNVWYAIFQNDKLSDVSFPKHDYMFKWYTEIKQNEKNLLNYVERLIKNREAPENIIAQSKQDVREKLHKFLSTLKWICLQEDANYPPPHKMGSKYTLAAYVLLDYGFEPYEIRRLIRFKTE